MQIWKLQATLKSYLFMKKLFKIILVITALLCATTMQAQQFSALSNGILLRFNVTNSIERTVEVTYYSLGSYTTGDIVIATSVVDLTTWQIWTVTAIGDSAFRDYSNITSIEIPNSVTSIGAGAFRNCTSLKNVILPNNITSIGNNVFENCTSLTSIEIPNTVAFIGNNAFMNCTSLTNVVIPNGIISIGYAAFVYCTSLTSVEIPNSVIFIEDAAFSGCTNLTDVVLSSNITAIGNRTFEDCTNLTNIVLPNNLISIGNSAFENCTSLTNLIFPNTVAIIGYRTFRYCTSLTDITIPNSATMIEADAFDYSGIKKLKFECGEMPLTIFDANTYYSTDPFSDCPIETIYVGRDIYGWKYGYDSNINALKSITFEECVTNIEAETYQNCSTLEEINFMSITPPQMTENPFMALDVNTCVVNVPCGSKPAYEAVLIWENYNIVEVGEECPPASLPNGVEVNKSPVAFFNIMGVKLNAEPASGVYIVQYDNGTVEKRVR